ncbi:MAG: hydrolase [Candidatus Marinimicrobia bacterium]|nr:hydrolase [Candidatus Neomarinimicrobiota bacterium]
MKPKKFVLIVIDVQGNLSQVMYQKEDLFKNLKILIKGATLLDLPIIWTEQLPNKLGSTIPEISELFANRKPIVKDVFSCARDEKFITALEKLKVDHVLLCGIETHVCVYQTALDLLEMEYHVDIVSDAVSSRTEANKQIGLDRVMLAGGSITSVETVLFEVQEVAIGDTFRELIKLVK